MYIKELVNGTIFPYILDNIRQENPNTSFPVNLELIMETFGVYRVEPVGLPPHNALTQYVEQDTPIKDAEGTYKQVWKIINRYSSEEEAKILLENAKSEKINQINGEFMLFEKDGWDSTRGYSLGTSPNDIALLTGLFSLAKEASALGQPLPSLISRENKQIDFNNIQEMTLLMLQYGEARASISKEFAAKLRLVQSAVTIEELQNI